MGVYRKYHCGEPSFLNQRDAGPQWEWVEVLPGDLVISLQSKRVTRPGWLSSCVSAILGNPSHK
jgi:chemotaxis receptor (MCP) glutamine deamidase CheD